MFVLRYTFEFESGAEMLDTYQQLITFRDKHPERTMRAYNNITGTQKTVLWEVEFEEVEEAAQWLTHRYGDLQEEIRAFSWTGPMTKRTAALKRRDLWRLAD